jgi:hypothetical protein
LNDKEKTKLENERRLLVEEIVYFDKENNKIKLATKFINIIFYLPKFSHLVLQNIIVHTFHLSLILGK